MNIIFQINGGLGKSVMATSVCKAIKIKYPDSKLIVVTAYPDVFLNNPNVDRCLRFAELKYFYKEYVYGKEFLFLGQEPYSTDEYFHENTHLVDIWSKIFDLPSVQHHGELFLTKREIDFYQRKYQFKKPILALQTSGGGADLMYNWGRDLPPSFVKKIVNTFHKEYDIVHIKNENQITYEGVTPFTDNIRAVCVIIGMSSKRIFIDSSCQHLASGLNLSSNIFWITTSPKVFGYENNNNIIANPETKPTSLANSFMSKYELVPSVSDFPYNDESEIFNEETLKNLI